MKACLLKFVEFHHLQKKNKTRCHRNGRKEWGKGEQFKKIKNQYNNNKKIKIKSHNKIKINGEKNTSKICDI